MNYHSNGMQTSAVWQKMTVNRRMGKYLESFVVVEVYLFCAISFEGYQWFVVQNYPQQSVSPFVGVSVLSMIKERDLLSWSLKKKRGVLLVFVVF